MSALFVACVVSLPITCLRHPRLVKDHRESQQHAVHGLTTMKMTFDIYSNHNIHSKQKKSHLSTHAMSQAVLQEISDGVAGEYTIATMNTMENFLNIYRLATQLIFLHSKIVPESSAPGVEHEERHFLLRHRRPRPSRPGSQDGCIIKS